VTRPLSSTLRRPSRPLSWAAAGLLLLTCGAVLAGTQERPDAQDRLALRKAIEQATSFKDRFDAQVWLLDMSTRLKDTIPDPHARLEMLRMVHQEASRVHLKPELVLAVIQVESNFNRFAISSAGARGLMQVMPFWLNELGRPEDNLFRARTNLRFGCTILRYYLDQEKGNLTRALARYNGSAGKHHYPDLVYSALRQRWYRQ
jgi:soluble lytic murein transglycosylase-like protein